MKNSIVPSDDSRPLDELIVRRAMHIDATLLGSVSFARQLRRPNLDSEWNKFWLHIEEISYLAISLGIEITAGSEQYVAGYDYAGRDFRHYRGWGGESDAWTLTEHLRWNDLDGDLQMAFARKVGRFFCLPGEKFHIYWPGPMKLLPPTTMDIINSMFSVTITEHD